MRIDVLGAFRELRCAAEATESSADVARRHRRGVMVARLRGAFASLVAGAAWRRAVRRGLGALMRRRERLSLTHTAVSTHTQTRAAAPESRELETGPTRRGRTPHPHAAHTREPRFFAISRLCRGYLHRCCTHCACRLGRVVLFNSSFLWFGSHPDTRQSMRFGLSRFSVAPRPRLRSRMLYNS